MALTSPHSPAALTGLGSGHVHREDPLEQPSSDGGFEQA